MKFVRKSWHHVTAMPVVIEYPVLVRDCHQVQTWCDAVYGLKGFVAIENGRLQMITQGDEGLETN